MITAIESQPSNDPQSDYNYIPTLLGSAAVIAGSTLWYLSSTSKNIEPQIIFGANSILFEIPKTTRKTFYGFGPEVKPASLEIELFNQDNETEDRRTVRLTKELPFKTVPITPNNRYAFKSRSKEDCCFWSKWVEHESFTSQPAPFSILTGTPSIMRCSQILQRIRMKHHFNSLVVGRPGAGKSSTINTMASAVAGERKCVAHVQPGHLTTTRHLIEHEIVPGKAYVYDMPGLEPKTKSEKESGKGLEKESEKEEDEYLQNFRAILQGNFNDETVRSLLGEQLQKKFTAVNNGEPKPKMDVVIFVISAIQIEHSIQIHQKMMKILKEENIPYLCIITKVDCIAPAIPRDKFSDDCRVIDACKDIPIQYKFPIINYSRSEETRPEIDEIILFALETAQSLASSDLVKA